MLKPWLESKIHNSWLDPKGASNTDEFFYQYTVAHGFAQAAQQVIEYVEQNLATAESLTNKQEGIVTEKKFNVGGD